ncbi:MAG TPA: hypothetical protein VM925_29030 [Labilithrix sp.]|nr:hypothetical protein [Labilithrix sp.]
MVTNAEGSWEVVFDESEARIVRAALSDDRVLAVLRERSDKSAELTLATRDGSRAQLQLEPGLLHSLAWG